MEALSNMLKSASSSHESKKKILLVDDVKLFIELEKTFFQRKDSFEILTAGNGKEALKIAEVEQPDLIYMDLYMPEMNGDECCNIIKNTSYGRNIPIVMVTSAGKENDSERCLAAGCDEIITKPINRAHFLSIAKKHLEVHERKEPRYMSHIKIKFGQNMDELLTDYTVNLNAGGLFLSSPRQLPVDTQLFVEFSLPEESKIICCQARIAWVNEADSPLKCDLPVGMGLEFVDLSPDDMNLILEYIEKNTLTADW